MMVMIPSPAMLKDTGRISLKMGLTKAAFLGGAFSISVSDPMQTVSAIRSNRCIRR